MNEFAKNTTIVALLLAWGSLVGCNSQTEPKPIDSAESELSENTAQIAPEKTKLSQSNTKQMAIAAKAKDSLVESLSSRLMEVMKAEGPVAAINVCRQEAKEMTKSVGEEHGVEIGRTSFKLRNPDNAPRDWVKPMVESRADTPQQVELQGGGLGALFPIHLDVKCLMCHGNPDDVLEDVKPELKKLYPNDQATGFKQGDLRGWIWVEVPNATDSATDESP